MLFSREFESVASFAVAFSPITINENEESDWAIMPVELSMPI